MRRTTLGQPAAGPVDWSWRLHAACRGVDTAVFYGPDDERPTRKRVREQRAKAICSTCPVLVPCRQHALVHREWYGVWGGLGERERQAIRQGMEHPRAAMC
jgi:WhiB family transcriptional regulator, redox-sensing transcriptional regulator